MTIVTYPWRKATALIFEGIISVIRNVFVGSSMETANDENLQLESIIS